MDHYKYVIIGGGTTAGYAAEEFAELGIGKGELCIVSAESILPMNRPPLSKEYLKDAGNDDELLINDKKFYENHGIEVKLKTCARGVDFGKKEVELDNGETLKYGKLLIAIGSSLKHLGVDGSNLDNIFYLRNSAHSDKIRKQAKRSKMAVVVGGGYIGSETAAVLSEMGVNVTMIIPEDHMLSKFATDEIAAFFEKKYNDNGINLVFKDRVIAFNGEDVVSEVELTSGKKLQADMVVVGIGVEPNVNLFKGSALKVDKGIIVNEFCETGVDGVYAAGDVVEFPDPIFGKLRHVEHWEHAFEQGKHAASVMSGKREPYVFLPYFFSDIFDLSYEYFGDQDTATTAVTRGNTEEGDFSQWWFDGDRVVAAFIMSSRPDKERDKARDWIKNRKYVDKERIADEKVDLDALDKQSEKYSDEPRA